jgi:sugar phosphate isomerase/epimerase
MTRRELMLAAAAAVAGATGPAAAQTTAPGTRTYCLFSKHLPDLNWSDVGKETKAAGFAGVDLTVRAGGHVLPERAVDDLPRALDAIRAHGLAVPMITTDLTSAASPVARPLLTTAARHGVAFFKTGYWRYTAARDVRAQVHAASQAIAGLAALAAECGIVMGVHNHAGYIAGAIWDIAPTMDTLDSTSAGYYFDPRHAVAEGGGGTWKAAANLVAPRLKMVALKDFAWAKTARGWQPRDCPLGEGMVDWPWFAAALRDAKFAGPISLHLEYEIAGATAAERTRNTLAAAVRDLGAAKRVLEA